MVEQLAFNQLVAGSSPAQPTTSTLTIGSNMKKYLIFGLLLTVTSIFAVSQSDLLNAQNTYQTIKKNYDKAQTKYSDAQKSQQNAKENLEQAKLDLKQAESETAKSKANLAVEKQKLDRATTNLYNIWNKLYPGQMQPNSNSTATVNKAKKS